uniref:Uncharacterized protein n=1 Tax=Rhizophora mucronata TaxID=61149 RepID=A0A2P2PPY3_RHIMU
MLKSRLLYTLSSPSKNPNATINRHLMTPIHHACLLRCKR